MYIRTIKVRSSAGNINEYVRVVEAYRDNGKVKQRVVADLGRKDVLAAMLPKLQRILAGDESPLAQGKRQHITLDEPCADALSPDELVDIMRAATWGPLLVIRFLFGKLGLWSLLDAVLGEVRRITIQETTYEVSYTDRVFVLIANRLLHPSSEHGLAGWLETAFVCDRQGRRFVPAWHKRGRVQVHHGQLDAWYRTLDRLLAAKSDIEVGLFNRLRDLFSLRPDLVLYDITSVYFEGAGPADLAKHGHSRDGKPQNVQVIVGVVMVCGWPIAHHVWEGNRVDHTTVQEAVKDLQQRFNFERVVFVGDRGMVTEKNLTALTEAGHGYLVGVKRRRNEHLDTWLAAVKEDQWADCPVGITASERKNPPRTRVQEVPSGRADQRVFVIDSDERREYEQAMRERSMQRAREGLEKVQKRVAAGRLTDPAKIGAAAERALQRHHGYRYYTWQLREGKFEFSEHPVHLAREKRLEGKYIIATSEMTMEMSEAVRLYKDLSEVERGFRSLKDVLAMRPVWHRSPERVRAHIFVAALALLVQRLLERCLSDAGLAMSASRAFEALSTLHLVTFRLDPRWMAGHGRGRVGIGEDDEGGEGQAQGRQPGIEDSPLRRGVSHGTPRAQEVLKALGITNLKPPKPPQEENQVM